MEQFQWEQKKVSLGFQTDLKNSDVLNFNPHYAIEMHLHNLTNENQILRLNNIFPIG